MGLFKKKNMKVPRHLAIILDGNGRWAQKQGKARTFGHQIGANTLTNIAQDAYDMGVEVLSLYCFSTENWKRDKEEVDFLMTLPIELFKKHIETIMKDDTRVIISGDMSVLPESTRIACEEAIAQSANNKSHVLNICLNYGSYAEITKAVKEIVSEAKEDKLQVENITPQTIEDHLYTKGLPPVDLLIRTSNERRISNFLLWQISYAEIYFTKTLWPAFTRRDLEIAFEDFAKRDRRFGGVKK